MKILFIDRKVSRRSHKNPASLGYGQPLKLRPCRSHSSRHPRMGHLSGERTFERPRTIGFGHDEMIRIPTCHIPNFFLIEDVRREGNIVSVTGHPLQGVTGALEPMEMGTSDAVFFEQITCDIRIFIYSVQNHRFMMLFSKCYKLLQ